MSNKLDNGEEVDAVTASWEPASKSLKKAARLIGIWQLLLIVLFGIYGTIPEMTATDPGTITQGYQYFIGVEIMMFIGFGYLMTFMKSNGLGAVAFTMLITAFGIQWYVFCESFFRQIYHGSASSSWHPVDFTIYSLMNALFGVSAVLISFGAIIGKVTPLQLVVMAIIELIMHALNIEWILIGGLKVADVGGTYADHMFGAYFGLAVAYMLGRSTHKSNCHVRYKHVDPAVGYFSDIFSFIGTLFLWIYWPSFVGGGATADSVQQTRAIINTILSLSASTLCTFYLSSFYTHGFVLRPIDLQNATLAGGVAIGCIANLNLNPVNAIFVGCAAGLVSTHGYHVIQPWVYQKLRIHDTCGVHNLHAMPSVIGAIASICLAAYKQSGGRNSDSEVYETMHGNQAWRQFVGALLTITCAVVSGLITGYLMRLADPDASSMMEYNDAVFFETASDFKHEVIGGAREADEEEMKQLMLEKQKQADLEQAGQEKSVELHSMLK